MKTLFSLLLFVFLVLSCTKEKKSSLPVVHPPMQYTDLNDAAIKFGQQKSLDIDSDNTNDLLFSTELVGDPVFKRDKRKYFVNGAFDVFSLVNAAEETPVLNSGDAISINNPTGYNWYNASSIVLAEKIIEETGPAHWEGNWKNAIHKYFAVQLRKNGLRYNGWVEISFNVESEELILHRAAVVREAGKDIIAGK